MLSLLPFTFGVPDSCSTHKEAISLLQRISKVPTELLSLKNVRQDHKSRLETSPCKMKQRGQEAPRRGSESHRPSVRPVCSHVGDWRSTFLTFQPTPSSYPPLLPFPVPPTSSITVCIYCLGHSYQIISRWPKQQKPIIGGWTSQMKVPSGPCAP